MQSNGFTKKILIVVDDDEDDQYLTQAAAQEAAMSTEIIFLNCAEVLLDYICKNNHYFFEQTTAPIILLDLNMPGMGGIAALEELKNNELTNSIPVLVYSTSDSELDIESAFAAGANTYMIKPTNFPDLVTMMNNINNFWIKTAQTPKLKVENF